MSENLRDLYPETDSIGGIIEAYEVDLSGFTLKEKVRIFEVVGAMIGETLDFDGKKLTRELEEGEGVVNATNYLRGVDLYSSGLILERKLTEDFVPLGLLYLKRQILDGEIPDDIGTVRVNQANEQFLLGNMHILTRNSAHEVAEQVEFRESLMGVVGTPYEQVAVEHGGYVPPVEEPESVITESDGVIYVDGDPVDNPEEFLPAEEEQS